MKHAASVRSEPGSNSPKKIFLSCLFDLVARICILLELTLPLRLRTLFSFQRSIPSSRKEGNQHKKICRQTPALGRLSIYSAPECLSSKFFINFCSQHKLACRRFTAYNSPRVLSAPTLYVLSPLLSSSFYKKSLPSSKESFTPLPVNLFEESSRKFQILRFSLTFQSALISYTIGLSKS